MVSEGVITAAALRGFERASQLCKQSQHLKPMVFEALMHLPLALIVKTDSYIHTNSNTVRMEPLLVEGSKVGANSPSHAVFTNIEHGIRLFQELDVSYCEGAPTSQLFKALLPECRNLIIDAGCAHQTNFSVDELRRLLAAWQAALPACDPFDDGDCHFQEESGHSQILLDRLDVLLSSISGVDRCYLVRTSKVGGVESTRLVLIAQCDHMVAFERIRQAMPLLGLDLSSHDVPHYLMLLNRHVGFAEGLRQVTPIYDRQSPAWDISKSTGS